MEGGFACALDLVRYIRKEYGDFFGISVAGKGLPWGLDLSVRLVTVSRGPVLSRCLARGVRVLIVPWATVSCPLRGRLGYPEGHPSRINPVEDVSKVGEGLTTHAVRLAASESLSPPRPPRPDS